MIFQSIKWRLQAWHALLLVAVLAGFGFTAWRLESVSRIQRIDRDLEQRAQVLLSALRKGGPPGPGERLPGPGFGEPDDGGPPPEGRPERGARRGPPISERELSLFGGSGTNACYFVLWHRDGAVIMKSPNTPGEVPRPARGAVAVEHLARTRCALREFARFTPPGECVLVGYNLSPELAESRRLAGLLLAAGSGVLLLGLAGGWWMATRAIRPIRDISATAARISAGDLSQRIPAGDAENELGQLAGVLNSTFSRLETAFAQQQQFTSDAAHELRTPVAVILAQTQSTLNRERTPAEYRETLEACHRAAQRMRRLIESLLELARFDAGQETLQRQPFDLAQVARDNVELIRPLAEQRGLKLFCEAASAPCAGDAERFAQVATNLLTNAIQYNRPGGEVRVTVKPEGASAVLTVADTGAGIAPADVPRLFERFYRADQSRTHTGGSAGLGLAICQAIVEAHSGRIEVKSEPGQGSTFTVRLPLDVAVKN